MGVIKESFDLYCLGCLANPPVHQPSYNVEDEVIQVKSVAINLSKNLKPLHLGDGVLYDNPYPGKASVSLLLLICEGLPPWLAPWKIDGTLRVILRHTLISFVAHRPNFFG